MLFTHLHALNAKAPYTKDKIFSDIDNWTSSTIGGKTKTIDMEIFSQTLDTTLQQWIPFPSSQCLTYHEFANDPLRWGTSGGAPPVVLFNKKIKSKWAWALYHLFDGTTMKDNPNIALEAEKASTTAKVALKEETQKTREIITTPIDSYLRQTYLLYRRKKIPIPSPISGPQWLPGMEATNYSWYGCIDGERFDHCVPKEAIIMLVDKLGDVDQETRQVADKEIQHLRSLTIEWSGRSWDFNGGVLSGWKFTSILGSLVSLAAANYIIRETGTRGSVYPGVMGDDVVLMSHTTSISAETMVSLYEQFGLKANLKKTVSGPQGEFLRKVRSRGGSWAFPALDLKTITHAAPWITNTQFIMEEECATAWHTLLSRMLPHSTDPDRIKAAIEKYTISDLNNRFGRDKDWSRWLHTPLSAGGGGYVETSNPAEWAVIEKEARNTDLSPYERLAQMLGVLPTAKTIKKVELTPIDVVAVIKDMNKKNRALIDEYIPRFRRDVNSTRATWLMLNNRIGRKEIDQLLVIPLPHRMRMWSAPRIAQLMSASRKTIDCVPSILHTKEALPAAGTVIANITKRLMARSSGIPANHVRPLATLYAISRYKNVPVPYGTW